ncbi:selenocysteine-specific translation elongation factor [Helicobacter cappadocius]|uniref:Selenocysteine-specific elongation factor n=1 Tax=Helicobacter cappadocius TaxID=3063998 RepID=A0AA90PYP4_9HELI|nr:MULTISPECIES: selenocysteine-specific translation elongation factor [unclassified Helicobacter]MDO7253028.1 selenocysteine-specific translation elongation factor [Helicobacter sp. faydin-H75]MDP2538983.1 selenocysteine-specific translation elongation factor [Helicobacter sp. faydin-H76]
MENNLIVGLAGHIDHGKTSLIKSLNGFDGDQREDEKQRGITLDISFSNLVLPPTPSAPNGKNISFIDVPGHERLIKNMIAGAFGIDILLLVIACNDGIMPQTLEHLQIADILGIKEAICIITKVDLYPPNTEFVDLKKQINELFSKLKHIKLKMISTFSIYNKNTHYHLLELLTITQPRKKEDESLFRYYIDRVFSISGKGTILSGTILSGMIKREEKLYICELNSEANIKTIKNHNTELEEARAGQRIAFNLRSINSSSLKRGYLLSKKGYLRGFDEFDVVIYPLKNIVSTHNSNVHFFIGSKKCSARIHLLNTPTEDQDYCFATIKTEEKIFGIFGERFILRNSEDTIAGGKILCPITDPMKKKQKLLYLDYISKKDFQNAFLLCCYVHKKGFGLVSSMQRFNLTHAEALKIAKSLPQLFLDEKNLIIYHPDTLKIIKEEILKIFAKNKNALLSASSLNVKFKWASLMITQNALDELLDEGKIYKKEGFYLSRQNNIKNISQYLEETLYNKIISQGYSPSAPYDIYNELDIDRKSGDNALKALSKAQKIVRLQHNLFIGTDTLTDIQKTLRQLIKENGYIDIFILKEKIGLSRKYLIAYLDYLDHFEDITNTQGKRTFKYKDSK